MSNTVSVPSLIVASIAAVLSLVAIMVSIFQKRAEEERTVRDQLTDVVGKLIENSIKAAELIDKARTESKPVPGVLLDQYRQTADALAQQANYLIDRRPSVVTGIDYITVAQAFVMTENLPGAEQFHGKAVDVAKGTSSRTHALWSYGTYLMRMRRADGAGDKFQQALNLSTTDDDLTRQTNGWTHQLWAFEAKRAGFFDRAEEHLAEAQRLYQLLEDPAAKQWYLSQLDRMKTSPAMAAPPQPPIPTGAPSQAAPAPPGGQVHGSRGESPHSP